MSTERVDRYYMLLKLFEAYALVQLRTVSSKDIINRLSRELASRLACIPSTRHCPWYLTTELVAPIDSFQTLDTGF